MRSQQAQKPSIQSNPSRKNFLRAPPRAAQKESALPSRAISPHRRSNPPLRNKTPLFRSDCGPPKTHATRLHVARLIPHEETFLLFQEAVQENRSTTRRQLRLYFHARAGCAPRSQTSALGKHSSVRTYSSRISSVKRLCSFIPEAPSSVRMALAVRPCRPITLPKSSGCTRSSTTVACGPSTVSTFTSSGWSTSALAICSTSSFIPAPPLPVQLRGPSGLHP